MYPFLPPYPHEYTLPYSVSANECRFPAAILITPTLLSVEIT